MTTINIGMVVTGGGAILCAMVVASMLFNRLWCTLTFRSCKGLVEHLHYTGASDEEMQQALDRWKRWMPRAAAALNFVLMSAIAETGYQWLLGFPFLGSCGWSTAFPIFLGGYLIGSARTTPGVAIGTILALGGGGIFLRVCI